MTRSALLALTLAAAVVLAVGSPAVSRAWDERSGSDMPWLGRGGRAHLYHQRSSCFGCPTGYRDEERWSRSAWSGESPYVTVSKAMKFLAGTSVLAGASASKGAGDVGGDGGIITPRARPYHFTVVMIEPTVIVMNFDLGALLHEGEPQRGQVISSPYIDGYVSYGTRIPATGSLLWYSPDAKQPPTPLSKQSAGKGEISVNGIALVLERRGDEWTVTRRSAPDRMTASRPRPSMAVESMIDSPRTTMASPIRAVPPEVDRWISRATWLRWCDAAVAWACVWAALVWMALPMPSSWMAALAVVLTGLGASIQPLRVVWRPITGAVGLAVSRRLRPGDRAWYVRSRQASLVLVTSRRGVRLAIAAPDLDEPEEVLRVRRTRVLLLPAEGARPT